MAPRAGFEPATERLTAVCSTTELPRNNIIPSKNGGIAYNKSSCGGLELFCIICIFYARNTDDFNKPNKTMANSLRFYGNCNDIHRRPHQAI